MPILGSLSAASISSFGFRSPVFGGSAFYNSANGKGLSVPASSKFAYGTGDFTVEMWINPSNVSTYKILWAQTGVYNSRAYWYFLLYLDPAARQLVFQMNPGAIAHPTSIPLNSWTHVAVVRRSNVVKLYVNGYGTGGATIATNLTDTTLPPTVGNYSLYYQSVNQGFVGYITNVRVAKSGIYSADFTPSRQPFTKTSQGATNVQLLLNHQTSSRLLTDSSTNALTVTNIGAVTYSDYSPFAQPYVNPTPVVIVSASVTPDVTTVSEGGTVTFTIAGTNTSNGTYYYTLEEPPGGTGTLTSADFSSGSLSGSFTITGNAGSIPITVTRDLSTEGDESFILYVRTGSITGTIIGNSSIIDITDTSLTPAFTVTPTTVAEGSSASFTVANVGPDGTYYWTVLNGTTANADFSAVSGSFTVSGSTGGVDNGTGTFTVNPVYDYLTDASETFTVSVRSGSVAGTVIVTSSTITVVDTSTTVTASGSPTAVNEGSPITITASATAFPAGTYYWTILAGTAVAADFAVSSGSFTVASNTGSFTVTPKTADGAEGAETFQVQIRTGSTSGTVIATTGSLTINASAT